MLLFLTELPDCFWGASDERYLTTSGAVRTPTELGLGTSGDVVAARFSLPGYPLANTSRSVVVRSTDCISEKVMRFRLELGVCHDQSVRQMVVEPRHDDRDQKGVAR